MKVTLLQCSKAYNALSRFGTQLMDMSIAKRIVALRKRLEPYHSDYMAKGRKLGEEYAVLDANGMLQTDAKGEFVLKDDSKRAEFLSRDAELTALVVAEEFEKVAIPFPRDAAITPAELEALEPFIDFDALK